MEDPWNSPWATDATLTPGKIALPSEPKQSHFGSSPHRSPSPSPWNPSGGDWGGWNDAIPGADGPWGVEIGGEEQLVINGHVGETGPDEGAQERGRSTLPDGEPLRALSEARVGVWQPSKVQELVEMYDGMTKSLSSADVPLAMASPGSLAGAKGDETNSSYTKHATDASSVDKTTAPSKPSPPTTLPYPIDLSLLDHVYPRTQPSTTHPESLGDAIITDTFSSVAQRKAWYRITRFGSIRRHNHGDEETYVRVAWHNSHIRKDVLTTVRRWMEEDSRGGRVRLGRRLGHAGASMFNWDSEAPDVQIRELLARDRTSHARQTLAAVQETVMSPAAASFGWTSVPSSPVDSRGFGGIGQVQPSPLTQVPGQCQGDESQGERTDNVERQRADDEVADDDWGEMISSTDESTSFRDSGTGARLPTHVDTSPAGADDGMRTACAPPVASRPRDAAYPSKTDVLGITTISSIEDVGNNDDEPPLDPGDRINAISSAGQDGSGEDVDPWGGLDILDASAPGGDLTPGRPAESIAGYDDGTTPTGTAVSPSRTCPSPTGLDPAWLNGGGTSITAHPACHTVSKNITTTQTASALTTESHVDAWNDDPWTISPTDCPSLAAGSNPWACASCEPACSPRHHSSNDVVVDRDPDSPTATEHAATIPDKGHCADDVVEGILRGLADLSYMLR